MKNTVRALLGLALSLAACGVRENDGEDPQLDLGPDSDVSQTDTDATDDEVDTEPRPTCFVDFPCEMYPNPFVASCTADGSGIAEHETFGCDEVCDDPCSGAGCRQLPAHACPGGTLCVEPVIYAAECRTAAETCGGAHDGPCPDGRRCVRRASAEYPYIECEIVTSDHHGVCELPDVDLPRCDESGLPIVANPHCGPLCARTTCEPTERLACEDACNQRMATAHGYCAACLVDTIDDAQCSARPLFDETVCQGICERPIADFGFGVEPNDLRCAAVCEELACAPELLAACQVDCAARLMYQTGLCALCLTETASPADCTGGGTGFPRYDLVGCEEICFMDLGSPIASGGAGQSCDGLCLRVPACDSIPCDNACSARLVDMPPLCANCLLDHADGEACETGTSDRPTFDYEACLGVCVRDTNDPPPLDSPDPELCRPACQALVCPDRQGRCVTDCGARISFVSNTCAACIVASLHAVDDCRWAFTPDACNDVCLLPP